jgi:hypothetical protein
MKKFLFLAISFTIGLASIAQTDSLKSQYSLTVDTVTNAGTNYLTSVKAKNKVPALIVFNAAKISGTVAGTASLEASVDGTTWYSYYGSKDSTYSFTLTNVSAQAYRWELPQLNDLYVRVKVTGSGTMAAKIYATLTKKQ